MKTYWNDSLQTRKATYHVRDASGNVMATYEHTADTLRLSEWALYGSSRIGVVSPDLQLHPVLPVTTDPLLVGVNYYTLNQKQYELSNHLGNVQATISDRRMPMYASSVFSHYETEVVSAQDYYPFGMVMPERSFSNEKYRYGFNGQEHDRDLNPSITTAEFWQYDGRLGRRWNRDPQGNVWESPYATFGSNPVRNNDPDGDFWHIAAGAGIGALARGGMEFASQYVAKGGNMSEIDFADIGVEALKGAGQGALLASGAGMGALATSEAIGKWGGTAAKASIDYNALDDSKSDKLKLVGGSKPISDALVDASVELIGGKLADNAVGNVSTAIKKVVNYELTEQAVAKASTVVVKETKALAKQLTKDVSALKQSTQSTVKRLEAATQNLNSAEATKFVKDAVLAPTITAVKTTVGAVQNKIQDTVKDVKNKVSSWLGL